MSAYLCEWERADSATIGLSESAMRAYYKAHSVSGDAIFALREDSTYPADLQACWRLLLAQITAKGKETPEHKAIRDELRKCWRLFADNRPYQVPTIALPVAATRKRAIKCCPHCGKVAA